MGVSFKKGTFVKATTVTTQDITDVGFEPKALILWTSNQTVETYEEHMMVSYGFSDGTTDCCTVNSSEDNVTTSDTYHNLHNDSIVMIINKETGALEAYASVNSFLSNGFQLNWVANTTPAAVIHYVAIGGTEITNVKAVARHIGTTDDTDIAFTGVGFQPDFLLVAGGDYQFFAGIDFPYDTTIKTACNIVISAMTSSSARWALAAVSEDNRADSDTWKWEDHAKCYGVLTNTTGDVFISADFVSFDTDGFTWNMSNGADADHSPLMYLAIKGGVWDVGNAIMPTTDSTVTTNTDATATLKGIMVHSMGNTVTQTVAIADNKLTIGGSDGTNNGLVSYCDNAAAALMVVTEIQNDNNCIMTHVANATATSSTTLQTGVATFNAHSFDIAYTNTDGTARLMTYWAVSEVEGEGEPPVDAEANGKMNFIAEDNIGAARFGG